MKRIFLFMVFIAVLGLTTLSDASLINNGGGLIYDTDLDITWYIAQPTLPEGTGNNGTWYTVNSWVAALTIGGVEAGTWRLPTTPGTTSTSTDGNVYTDEGEMGHLFYHELDGIAATSIESVHNDNYTLFPYLMPGGYWTGTDVLGKDGYAWRFDFSQGKQYCPYTKDTVDGLAMAVHAGSVSAPVPIPAAIWLLGSGLIGLVGLRRKFKK